MPCDLICSCFECPELRSYAERGERQEIALYFCPIAMQQREEDVAANT